ncbi:hypothetical protein [Salipaludibacillus sp. CF4.18]|uniref:hypothetical protein n=1 Tax=Salipaludibacillus sp. CF4.18 TaxID=3373081 RepID=UPI003EE56FA7
MENKPQNQPIIVVHGNYFKGIMGIIASRIAEKYKKPSIVISECGTASFRGVNGSDFSISNTQEFLTQVSVKLSFLDGISQNHLNIMVQFL